MLLNAVEKLCGSARMPALASRTYTCGLLYPVDRRFFLIQSATTQARSYGPGGHR